MSRKISTFIVSNNKKIIFFVLFFFHYFTIICQSKTYSSNQEYKILYQKLFENQLSSKELQKLWEACYPFPQDTLIYLAKLNFKQENSMLNFYYQTQENIFWTFLAIFLTNLILIGVIFPFLKRKKIFLSFLLLLNLWLFFYKKSYFLYQEWVFLPTKTTLYEEPTFVAKSLVEFPQPKIGLVIEKQNFWWKIETENGSFWVPYFQVIQ